MLWALFVFSVTPSVGATVDRVARTQFAKSTVFSDPRWATVSVVLSLSAYALLRTRDERSAA